MTNQEIDEMNKYTKATRELVDSLLAINTANRNIDKNKLQQYKADILAGRFGTVRYTSKFLVNKSWTKLIDGQTRLTAIKECGYPVFDIDLQEVPDDMANEVMEYVDQGKNRTISDVYEIKGKHIENKTVVIAIITAFMRTMETIRGKMAWKAFDEYYAAFGELAHELSTLNGLTGCERSKCTSRVMAGVLHAILRNPNQKEEILAHWKNVRTDHLASGGDKTLRKIIKVKSVDTPQGWNVEPYVSALVSKGLSCPQLGVLKIVDKSEIDRWLYNPILPIAALADIARNQITQ